MSVVESVRIDDGVSLAFRSWPGARPGSGPAAPVVPLHGLGCTAATWDDGDLPYGWGVVAAVRERVRQPNPSWPGPLPSVLAPALVLAGGPTSQVPQDRIAEMAGLMRSATLVTIGAGHRIHQAKPEAFVAEVVAFPG